MELKDLIREYKDKYQLSNNEIASHFHVSSNTVSRWLRGEVKTIQEETARRISDRVGYDIQAMIKGTAVVLTRPVLGQVKAGYDLLLDEQYSRSEEVSLKEYQQGDFFLEVVGNSMIDAGIVDGGLVYVKQCATLHNGEIGVISIGDEVTIKQFQKTGSSIKLVAMNTEVEDRIYNIQDMEQQPIRIIGKVVYSKNYL